MWADAAEWTGFGKRDFAKQLTVFPKFWTGLQGHRGATVQEWWVRSGKRHSERSKESASGRAVQSRFLAVLGMTTMHAHGGQHPKTRNGRKPEGQKARNGREVLCIPSLGF